MKRFYFLIFPLIVLLITSVDWGSVHAQDTQSIQIDALDVQLLPEYEPESMLVIWKIGLSEDTSLPRELMVKIPAEAEIQSITLVENDGGQILVNAEGEAITIGEWQNIRLTTTLPEVHMTYLDPNLTEENNQRIFNFSWISSYTVNTITINVYQPHGINDINTTPPLPLITDKTNPISQYTGELGAVSAGENFTFTLSYSNGAGTPAYPNLDVVPAMPVDERTTGRSASPLSVILWLIAVAVSILFLVGWYFWWIRKNIMEKRNRAYQGVGTMNLERQVVYCHECGMRSESNDNYCRNCGTALHQSTQRNQIPQI